MRWDFTKNAAADEVRDERNVRGWLRATVRRAERNDISVGERGVVIGRGGVCSCESGLVD